MATHIVPPQDPRYSDSGRREAVIGARSLPCAIRKLPDDHPDRSRASHIVTCRWVSARPGTEFTANGNPYIVVMTRDPNASGPKHMIRKFVEILCNATKS